MLTFFQLLQLLIEEQDRRVPPAILKGYDLELRRQLERLATTITDPRVRAQFLELIDCPLVDSRGNCRDFAEYVMASLLKNGVQDRYDIEQAIQYVFEKMLLSRSESGGERSTIFTNFDANQPDSAEHFRARFLSFLTFAVGNIKRGKIRRLANVQPRPQGTVSIGQGRWREGDPTGTISPDEIAERPSSDADLTEIVADISDLLRRKETAYGLPLTALFKAIMAGQRTDQQVRQFGDGPTRMMRNILKDTLLDYGKSSGNFRLLYLLSQFQGFQGNQPLQSRRPPPPPPKPVVPADPRERDYRSIVSVIEKFGKAGSSLLGSVRRRWLSFSPRNPASGARNRLEEVLADMQRDGVLTATRTAQGAYVYSPGPAFNRYRQGVSV